MIALYLTYFLLMPIRDFFLYRLRGMSDEQRHTDFKSTTLVRIVFWGIPCGIDSAILAHLMGSHDHVATIMVAGLLAGWAAAAMGHSSSQGTGWMNYISMGFITTGMLTIMLSPLLLVDLQLITIMPLGMLGAVASWLGYSSFVEHRTFSLFGILFCAPVGSEWEEAFIGFLAFGIPKASLGIALVLHTGLV